MLSLLDIFNHSNQAGLICRECVDAVSAGCVQPTGYLCSKYRNQADVTRIPEEWPTSYVRTERERQRERKTPGPTHTLTHTFRNFIRDIHVFAGGHLGDRLHRLRAVGRSASFRNHFPQRNLLQNHFQQIPHPFPSLLIVTVRDPYAFVPQTGVFAGATFLDKLMHFQKSILSKNSLWSLRIG